MSEPNVRRLLVLRHAHSSWERPGERDHDRPLDEKGRKQLRRLAEKLHGQVPDVRHVVCSTARRARDTLAAIRPLLPADVAAEFSEDLYGLGAQAYRSAAARCLAFGSTLLVGHNPSVEIFCRSLAAADERGSRVLAEGYGTACLCAFAVPLLREGEVDLGVARLLEWIEP